MSRRAWGEVPLARVLGYAIPGDAAQVFTPGASGMVYDPPPLLTDETDGADLMVQAEREIRRLRRELEKERERRREESDRAYQRFREALIEAYDGL